MRALLPSAVGAQGPLAPRQVDLDVLLTAETHNFPCAVAPYPGTPPSAGSSRLLRCLTTCTGAGQSQHLAK